jgi:hypothetical protein
VTPEAICSQLSGGGVGEGGGRGGGGDGGGGGEGGLGGGGAPTYASSCPRSPAAHSSDSLCCTSLQHQSSSASGSQLKVQRAEGSSSALQLCTL